MESVNNIFACLVHENFECVIDLLRNLRYLDPGSPILLYNGSANRHLLSNGFPFERYQAAIVPTSKPLSWGRLHDFAFECFHFAIQNYRFITLTIVDSDQLLIHENYSEFIKQWLQDKPRVGLLGSPDKQFGTQTKQFVTRVTNTEINLWRPLVERYQADLAKFVCWSFWPATVFTYAAAKDLSTVFLNDSLLREVLGQTRVHATEEVLFPILVNLLGYEIRENPCDFQFIRYRFTFTLDKIELAMRSARAYWLHPVPRQYDDPVRKAIRTKYNHYSFPANLAENLSYPPGNRLFLTLPVLRTMGSVEGWLDEEEADLLISITRYAASQFSSEGEHTIVEVGCYCGKATIVIGLTLKLLGENRFRVYSIDPHDGRIGSLDQGIVQLTPSFEKFCRNIKEAGIAEFVEPMKTRSYDLNWRMPIDLLLIDGLHDYPSVACDFYHFAPWLRPGALVAFHDYAEYYPGVVSFVDELIRQGEYCLKDIAKSLVVLEKTS